MSPTSYQTAPSRVILIFGGLKTTIIIYHIQLLNAKKQKSSTFFIVHEILVPCFYMCNNIYNQVILIVFLPHLDGSLHL